MAIPARVTALALLAAGLVAVGGCAAHSRTDAVMVVQTSRSLSQRMTRLPNQSFHMRPPRGVQIIHVNAGVHYQRIVGVGAAITDSSAWLLHDQLAPATRATVMRRLFGADGIHLGIVRLPIGATDFTVRGTPYSYDDLPAGHSDPTLSRFSIAHDEANVIPTMRQILAINPHIAVLAAPWSPPAWMKSNDSLGNQGNGGTLKPRAYGPLARYLVKFIEAYAAHGVKIDDISPQNEPGQASSYPGLNLSVPAQALFISRYLAPALAAAGLHPMIYAHDYKWLFADRAAALASNPAVARVLAGIAWHCYDGNPVVMAAQHRATPQLAQIESECSSGSSPGPPAELMIASFRNWATSVLLWNIALDHHGGPVQPPNRGCPYCRGVLTVDEQSHRVVYGRDYYQLGQFSAYVEPGALRIGSEHFVTYNTRTHFHKVDYSTDGIDDVAFVNPGGSKVLMVHNNGRMARRFAVDWQGRAFTYSLPSEATVTFVWR